MKTIPCVVTCCAIAATVFVPAAMRPAGAASPLSAAAAASEAATPTPVEDDMHEFMEYVFQPPYKRLKASLANQPADKRAWKLVKSDSLILAESANLLLSRVPDKEGQDWLDHATAVRTAGSDLYRSAKKNDFAATRAAFASMLNKCNGCHKQFEEGKHILAP